MSKNTVKSDLCRALVIAIQSLDNSGGKNDRILADRLEVIKDGIDEGEVLIIDRRSDKKKGS